MEQGQHGDKLPTKLMSLAEAIAKQKEFKKQGVTYPTIMSIHGTGKYRVIEGRAAKGIK